MIEALTYNVEYGINLEQIFEWINGLERIPSLLCLQEFPAARLKDIPELCTSHHGFEFAPSIVKKEQVWGELTAFDKEKFELVRAEVVDLGDSEFERRFRGFSAWRTALVTDLKCEGGELTVANAHLTWFALNSRRLQQLATILDKMGEPEHALVAGDFNYPKRNDLFNPNRLNKFMGQKGFVFAGPNTYTHITWGIFHQRIDYVFQKGCVVNGMRVERPTLSDHFPVLFGFELD